MTDMQDQGQAEQVWYQDPKDQHNEDSGALKEMDPLTVRPRMSSRMLCLVLGLLMLAASAGVWWLAVYTMGGQSYDDMVISNFNGFVDQVPLIKAYLGIFTMPYVAAGMCVLIGLIALVVVLVRRRWWLLGQVVVYPLLAYLSGRILKKYLPRPLLINVLSTKENSAPSGHTIMAVTAVLVLLFVVPRVWRALVALIGFAFTLSVGCSLILGGWHRPADVVMSILIAGGLGLITLVFTRSSGMDLPGTRMSSASVQIVSTLMMTLGTLGTLYAVFVIWQISSGLEMSARWTFYGAHCSAVILIASLLSLLLGLSLAMRQVTASPLTRLGLVGEPPAPPREI